MPLQVALLMGPALERIHIWWEDFFPLKINQYEVGDKYSQDLILSPLHSPEATVCL